jgi:hypothetical protein
VTPLVTGLLVGGSLLASAAPVGVALLAVLAVLVLAVRYGTVLSGLVFSPNDEVLLLRDRRAGGVRRLEPALGPLATAYVLVLAVLGPVLARVVDPLVGRWRSRAGGRAGAPAPARAEASELSRSRSA